MAFSPASWSPHRLKQGRVDPSTNLSNGLMEAIPQFALELSTKVTLIKCPSLVQPASLSSVCRLADSTTYPLLLLANSC